MTKRALTATTIAAALVLAPATAAQAGPADRSTKELEQEISQYNEERRTPLWQLMPDRRPAYGIADVILGVTFIVGAIVLY